jgi:hypothetical protein
MFNTPFSFSLSQSYALADFHSNKAPQYESHLFIYCPPHHAHSQQQQQQQHSDMENAFFVVEGILFCK